MQDFNYFNYFLKQWTRSEKKWLCCVLQASSNIYLKEWNKFLEWTIIREIFITIYLFLINNHSMLDTGYVRKPLQAASKCSHHQYIPTACQATTTLVMSLLCSLAVELLFDISCLCWQPQKPHIWWLLCLSTPVALYLLLLVANCCVCPLWSNTLPPLFPMLLCTITYRECFLEPTLIVLGQECTVATLALTWIHIYDPIIPFCTSKNAKLAHHAEPAGCLGNLQIVCWYLHCGSSTDFFFA